MTRKSIESIRTKKKIAALEIDYIKMRSSAEKIERLCLRYPALKEIDDFSPGFVAVFFDVINYLNQNGNQTEFESVELIQEKVLKLAKKVRISKTITLTIYMSPVSNRLN